MSVIRNKHLFFSQEKVKYVVFSTWFASIFIFVHSLFHSLQQKCFEPLLCVRLWATQGVVQSETMHTPHQRAHRLLKTSVDNTSISTSSYPLSTCSKYVRNFLSLQTYILQQQKPKLKDFEWVTLWATVTEPQLDRLQSTYSWLALKPSPWDSPMTFPWCQTKVDWTLACMLSHLSSWPMDCGPPGSSVLGISQARILEWAATSFSRGSSWTKDQIPVYCTGSQILYCWATRDAPSYV